MMRRVGILMALVGACSPARPAPTPATQKLNAPAVIPVPPSAAPEEACVSPEVEAEFLCRPEDDRVSPEFPRWPSAEFLFHYPPRKPWVSTVLPAIAVSEAMKAAEKPAANGQWRAARDAYSALLKTMPNDDAQRAYAYARVAQLSENLGLFDDALAAVLAEKDVLRNVPGSMAAEALAARMPAALGRAFARSKRTPDDVAALSDDELESLVDGYRDAMKYDAARTVLGELIKRSDPVRGCVYGARRVSTLIEQNPASQKRLMDAVQDQRKLIAPTNAAACHAATLAVTEELAMAMNIDAAGWNGARGTGDKRTLDNASALYRILEEDVRHRESWPPWFADEQRPTLPQIILAKAELFRFEHDYEKCGPMFEAAAMHPIDPAIRAGALSRATHCFLDAIPSSKLNGPITPVEEGLVRTGGRYLCLVGGDKAEIGLARGRVFYRGEQWEKAVAALAETAFTPGRREAREAAALYLVALYRIRETSKRPSCHEQRERDQARLVALHCSGADEDEPTGPALVGLTTSDPKRAITPCEAMRNLGAPPPPVPEPPPKPRAPGFRGGDSVRVSGSAIPQVVAWATRLHGGQFQACYDLALERNPFAAGRESVSFIIARDGSVSTVKASSEDEPLADKELHACIMRVAGAMSFSQPEGGLVDTQWMLVLDRIRGAHFRGLPSITQR